MIRVLLVDDSAVFRAGMTSLLATVPEIELCATAADGATGVDAALQHQPDVVLMDIAMPQTSGIEATRTLQDRAPHIGVVVMTMLEEDDAVGQALRAGARGYLVKGAPRVEIIETIRGVHAGRAVIGAATAKQLSSVLTAGISPDPFPDLTPRERSVLEELARGASTSQIASRLNLSDKNRPQSPLKHLHQAARRRSDTGSTEGPGTRPRHDELNHPDASGRMPWRFGTRLTEASIIRSRL